MLRRCSSARQQRCQLGRSAKFKCQVIPLLTEFRRAQDVLAPESVAVSAAKQFADLFMGAPVGSTHQADFICPKRHVRFFRSSNLAVAFSSLFVHSDDFSPNPFGSGQVISAAPLAFFGIEHHGFG